VTVGRELRCTLADRSPPHVAGCIAPHQKSGHSSRGGKVSGNAERNCDYWRYIRYEK